MPAIQMEASSKTKPLTAATSPRGECIVRLPALDATYTVRASAKGFAAQEKTVSVQSGQRGEVTFLLAPESKK